MVGVGKVGEVGLESLNLDILFSNFNLTIPKKDLPKKEKQMWCFLDFFVTPKVNQAHKGCYCVRAIGVLSFKLRVPKCQPSSSRVILF